jgi:uncharacterized phage protein (TIGR01671 family)
VLDVGISSKTNNIIYSDEATIKELDEYLQQNADVHFVNKILEQVNEKQEVALPETFLIKWLIFSNQNITSEEQAKEILEAEKNIIKGQILEGKLMNDNNIQLDYAEVLGQAEQLVRNQLAIYGIHHLGDDEIQKYAAEMLKDENQVRQISSEVAMAKLKDVILEQYTGLKDKNGREIYEGDIVRWGLGFTGNWDKESWHRYAVVELFPSLQFRIIYYVVGETGEKKETDNHVFEFGSFAYKETHKYIEVIGNIYENPELLERGWLPPQSVHTASSFISCWARARAVPSRAMRSAREPAALLPSSAMTDSLTLAISINPIRSARKAATASSLAALREVVAPCPCWHALMASARQG